MAKRTILTFPDPRLRNKARPVEQCDGALQRIVDDMLETMYTAPGIGLAAPQINLPLRLLVLDLSEKHNRPLCLVNPMLILQEGSLQVEEGCLSVPGCFEMVTRAAMIRVDAHDRHGKPLRIDADDLLAVCIQHELDHLDGKLFVDHLSLLKRQRIRQRLERKQRQNNSVSARHNNLI